MVRTAQEIERPTRSAVVCFIDDHDVPRLRAQFADAIETTAARSEEYVPVADVGSRREHVPASLALATGKIESEHQGALDRIAVRVELLRRRLAAVPTARSHYVTLVDRLSVPKRLRRILIDHIGS